jgi:hypothetical protein
MTAMPRSSFWRGFEHGQGFGALFVDFRPASVQDEKRIASYASTARILAIIMLCVVASGVVILVKSGHVWGAVALVGFVIFTTVVQLINHAENH